MSRAVEAALTPATRMVFVETIANPRTQVADLAHIGELCAARGLDLCRRQHDDLAVSVSSEDGRGEPRRQCADQVHRRPRQRARRQRYRDRTASTGRAIRTSTTPTRDQSRRCGASRRSARKACATGAARWPPSRRITLRSARKRSRCAWSAPAPMRWRWRNFSPHTRASGRSITRASLASAARTGARAFRRFRRAALVRAGRRRSIASIF